MIQYTIYNTTTRWVEYSGWTYDLDSVVVPEGSSIVVGTEYGPGFIDDGEFSPIPNKPTIGVYRFDIPSRQWVSLETVDRQWDCVRTERNKLLQASDWTQLPDVNLDTRVEWATYRSELRDVTTQPDPFNIIWPTPPIK